MSNISNESSSQTPQTHKERIFNTLMDGAKEYDFAEDIEDLGRNDCANYLGITAILEMYRRDVLEQFVDWAIHPRSGIIAQRHEMHPLPDDVLAVLNPLIENIKDKMSNVNTEKKLLTNNPQSDFSRRQFIKRTANCAATGAVTLALIDPVLCNNYSIPNPDPLKSSLRAAVVGGIAGGVYGGYLSREEMLDQAASSLGQKHKINAINLDRTTKSAASVLEQYLAQKQNITL